jgi:hypothetical protein
MKELSPSMLPKLEGCPVYVSQWTTSPAAERGTRVDKWIRDRIHILTDHEPLPEDERETVMWGVNKLLELAGDHKLECRETHLAMSVPALSKVGTADALCVDGGWLADIKTGQVRDYLAQAAAYSWACMERYFTDYWVAHIIYVDQRLVRTYEFTIEQAEKITWRAVDRATWVHAQPTPCEFCDWCANKDTCKSLVFQSKAALADVASVNNDSLTIIRDRILADPQQHVDFVTRFKFFVKEFGDPLTDALRARLEAGETIDGWALTNPKEKQYIEPATAMMVAGQLDPLTAFLAGGGKMSAEQFLEFAQELQIENPHSLVKSAPGTKAMRQIKKKN